LATTLVHALWVTIAPWEQVCLFHAQLAPSVPTRRISLQLSARIARQAPTAKASAWLLSLVIARLATSAPKNQRKRTLMQTSAHLVTTVPQAVPRNKTAPLGITKTTITRPPASTAHLATIAKSIPSRQSSALLETIVRLGLPRKMVFPARQERTSP